MAGKPVWHNDIERDAFIETNCRVCFQPDEAAHRVLGTGDGCPHLIRAAADRMPKAWERRRNAVMGETYRCSDFADKPPTKRRKTAPADTVEMFDVEPGEIDFVPVDGWPSAEAFGKAKKSKDDHA